MHTRPPQSHAQRRSSSRPLDVAASLVLTVGLLGAAAPVTYAAEAEPVTAGSTATPVALPQIAPSPSSSPAVEHPALKRSVVAEFVPPAEPGGSITIDFAIRLENTGDVPLNVFFDAYPRPDDAPYTLAVGESRDIRENDLATLEEILETGSWEIRAEGQAYTPLGARIDAGVSASIPYPAGVPGLEHAVFDRSVTAVFEPSESGTKVTYTLHLKNSGNTP